MTAQIGDTFRYKNNEYSIVAISAPIQFNPKHYGITPEAACSACWNGYWCDYKISDKGILLQNLYVNSKDDYYPEINGVKACEEEKEDFQYMGHHLYKDINLPIFYSGKIVVGKDFLNEYYIHMGYQRAWAYKTLYEFVFERGLLQDTIDHSDVAAKLREEFKNNNTIKRQPETEAEIHKFVEDSFSLDLDTKAWWI